MIRSPTSYKMGQIFLFFLKASSSNGHDSIGSTAAVAQQAMAALEERGAKISEVAEKSEQLKEVPPPCEPLLP